MGYFPEVKIEILSSDTVKNPHAMSTLLKKIQNCEIDIIIGTQMISKGHNFKNLTLVGIIDADMSLSGGDLRASEKAFQILHQVSGRAGRENKKGIVSSVLKKEKATAVSTKLNFFDMPNQLLPEK